MALRASGRSIVMTATGPVTSRRTPPSGVGASLIAGENIFSRVVEPEWTTEAGIPVDRSYGPERVGPDAAARIGEPGEYPFTRGNHPGGYRDKLWTFRQYSGFGTP